MKVRILVLSETPLTLNLTKNGRAVGDAAARSALAKAYPLLPVEGWSLGRSDHSTVATYNGPRPVPV